MQENKSFCKLQSDKLGYLSSQPRYVLPAYPKFFARLSLHKISTAATPFCSLHPPPAAVANVPTSISLRIWLCLNFAHLLQGRRKNEYVYCTSFINVHHTTDLVSISHIQKKIKCYFGLFLIFQKIFSKNMLSLFSIKKIIE